ncbi:hypothetical protein ACLOJK_037510 [Asimina triloba]
MQESLLVGNGVVFYRILEAVSYEGPGDKIKLPPSCFTELSGQGALDKGPMYFQLSMIHQEGPLNAGEPDQEHHVTTHSGVLEFTANEGSVELPPHVWSNLFPAFSQNAPLIEVRYVRLPKGTYAKLQPDGMGFSDLPNHKAILETSLRQHATLSEGDIVTVNHGKLSYKLRVLELKPSSSISVLETDIEVDIVGPESTIDRTDRNVLIPLELGKVESGIVEEGKYSYYKFSVDNVVGQVISSGNMNIVVKLDLETDGGDTDLYVSRHPVIFPTKHQHQWSSHDVGSKVLILSPKDQGSVSGTYSIAVFGFKGLTKFLISVALEDSSSCKVGEQTVSSSSSADVTVCQNCGHYIPSRTIALHEAYCSRHNVICQHHGCGIVLRKEEAANHIHCSKCARAFQQGEIEKHMKVFHEPLHCPCGVILEKEEMVSSRMLKISLASYVISFGGSLCLLNCEWPVRLLPPVRLLAGAGFYFIGSVQHQSSYCHLRLITCRFCGDMVPAGSSPSDARDRLRGLSEHESICGSRTAPCDSCGRAVMLKDMDIHRIAVHPNN